MAAVSTLYDISERRHSEAERLYLLQRERVAREQAEAAVKIRDEVLASVTHDLKTPITTLSGAAQLLARRVARQGTAEPERVLEGLDRIQGATARMAAMLDELLDAAHLAAGQPLVLRRGHYDLVQLAREAVAEHQQATSRHAIEVYTEETELPGNWDETRLRRVLDNLSSNAVKYSPNGGTISVELARDVTDAVTWATVRVSDHGVGIPPKDLPHVFERFHRGANVGEIRGAGIRLSGACLIVRQHRGSLDVDSSLGQGTTFTIRVPTSSPEIWKTEVRLQVEPVGQRFAQQPIDIGGRSPRTQQVRAWHAAQRVGDSLRHQGRPEHGTAEAQHLVERHVRSELRTICRFGADEHTRRERPSKAASLGGSRGPTGWPRQ